jgi:hypothetical protein
MSEAPAPGAESAPAPESGLPPPPTVESRPLGPCDAMRAEADWTVRELPPPMARAIRRFYDRRVLARGIDRRTLARHPLIMARQDTAPGAAASACFGEWRAADPHGHVWGAAEGFLTDHSYAEVTFEFNDASDGENAYTAFIDTTTLEVVAAFSYNNFQP